MSDVHWTIMPIAGAEAYTDQAIADVLAQTVPTKLLLINQALPTPFRTHLEQLAEQQPDRILLWSHVPSLPSLSATWNRALQFCWECGAEEALVANNDLRLHRETIGMLSWARKKTEALFVTAVGVRETQFDPLLDYAYEENTKDLLTNRGGPDFSCFLISKEGHQKYPFDEGFVPLYAEDCDLHRRYMLGGDGGRIFSINVPYWHIDHGSGTLKSLPATERTKLERRIEQSRTYYAQKWGSGGINHESLTVPFDLESAQEGVTNPELQRKVLEGIGCTTP